MTLYDFLTLSILIAAICTTAFPFVYGLSSWRYSGLGRALMFWAITIAFITDLTFILGLRLRPSFEVGAYLSIIAFLLLSASSITMTLYMLHFNSMKEDKE